MNAKFLKISCGILVLTAAACNNASESKSEATDTTEVVAQDTAVAVAPAPAEAPPVDSAAIIQEYLAAQKKTKKTEPSKPKKQGKNEVIIYSEETIPAHEALEQPAPAAATAAKPAPEKIIHTKEFVYFTPSENPSFPGGAPALKEFIKKNMVYPEDALRFHVEGTVYAEVYLDEAGNVTNVEFPGKHVGSGLEEETKTILMGSPRWHPARENGQPVKSVITVPVVYRIKH